MRHQHRPRSHRRLRRPQAAALVVGILRDDKVGAATAALCSQHGISEETFTRWRQRHGSLEQGEARRPKALEEETARPNRPVAEQALDNQPLEELLR